MSKQDTRPVRGHGNIRILGAPYRVRQREDPNLLQWKLQPHLEQCKISTAPVRFCNKQHPTVRKPYRKLDHLALRAAGQHSGTSNGVGKGFLSIHSRKG